MLKEMEKNQVSIFFQSDTESASVTPNHVSPQKSLPTRKCSRAEQGKTKRPAVCLSKHTRLLAARLSFHETTARIPQRTTRSRRHPSNQFLLPQLQRAHAAYPRVRLQMRAGAHRTTTARHHDRLK